MPAPLTLRLDEETRRRVARIARQRKTSTSAVLREVIKTWVQREESAPSAYELLKPYIGVVRGGDPTLSSNTGRRFTEMLEARRKKS